MPGSECVSAEASALLESASGSARLFYQEGLQAGNDSFWRELVSVSVIIVNVPNVGPLINLRLDKVLSVIGLNPVADNRGWASLGWQLGVAVRSSGTSASRAGGPPIEALSAGITETALFKEALPNWPADQPEWMTESWKANLPAKRRAELGFEKSLRFIST